MKVTSHFFVSSWFLLLEIISIGCSATAPPRMAGMVGTFILVAMEREIL